MKPISIQQIRQIVGGKALTSLSAEAPQIKAVSTDTRRMDPGSLFIAIKGENSDGLQYLPDAAAKGAVAALVEQPPATMLPNMCLIQVANARAAMATLAKHVRSQMKAKAI